MVFKDGGGGWDKVRKRQGDLDGYGGDERGKERVGEIVCWLAGGGCGSLYTLG